MNQKHLFSNLSDNCPTCAETKQLRPYGGLEADTRSLGSQFWFGAGLKPASLNPDAREVYNPREIYVNGGKEDGMARYFMVWITILVLSAHGCGLAAQKAVQTARGGHGHYLTITHMSNLSNYNSVDFVPLENAVGGNLSAELLQEVNGQVRAGLRESGIRTSGTKSLELRGKVIHIDDGVISNQILVQVDLRDSQTGSSVGRANVSGEVEGARGLKAAAQGVAHGVMKLLADNHFPGAKGSTIH